MGSSRNELQNETHTISRLNVLFKQLMNSRDVTLFPFQERVALSLLSGKNVILRAPTGSGKTWASLLPFILGRQEGKPLQDRVIYALPLRSLASQLYQTTKEACRYVKLSGKVETIDVTIQTGEQQKDKFFQGEIIFTTIDQLLSAYLMAPVSLPKRLANINAGVLVGSLLILDEFHLLDPRRSMGTAIEMLGRLEGCCSFVLMTATLSDNAIDWLRNRLSNTVVIDPLPEEILLIENRKKEPTNRRWIYEDKEISIQQILDNHCSRTLLIANTVSRAQQFYKELRRLASEETIVHLLHSRFYPEDRKNIERESMLRLGKGTQADRGSYILVSTQVVEAGMDFSVERLYSELAPINSLVQRAGRCARYGGEGTVTVFSPAGYLPYGKEDMDATAKVLRELSGSVFTWEQERSAVNAVLGEREAGFLSSYGNMYSRRKKVNLAMDGALEGAREELIRDINSISVIVTDRPELIRLDYIESWPEMLAVPTSSVRSFFQKMFGRAETEWLIKAPYPADTGADEEMTLRFNWRELEAGMIPAAWLLAVNPKFVSYTKELGLILGGPAGKTDVRYARREVRRRYRYRVETFSEHVQRVLKQYRQQQKRYLCSLRLLAKHLGIDEKTIEKGGTLAVILHDAGKLGDGWQAVARKWQELKTPGQVPSVPLSHMDYDPLADGRVPQRPPHAVEGAYAVSDYLFAVFKGTEDLAACVLTAIARHHTGHAKNLGMFALDKMAVDFLNSSLQKESLPVLDRLLEKPEEVNKKAFSRELLSACNEEDSRWLPLYWYLVRRLRLADQAGTAEGVKR